MFGEEGPRLGLVVRGVFEGGPRLVGEGGDFADIAVVDIEEAEDVEARARDGCIRLGADGGDEAVLFEHLRAGREARADEAGRRGVDGPARDDDEFVRAEAEEAVPGAPCVAAGAFHRGEGCLAEAREEGLVGAAFAPDAGPVEEAVEGHGVTSGSSHPGGGSGFQLMPRRESPFERSTGAKSSHSPGVQSSSMTG